MRMRGGKIVRQAKAVVSVPTGSIRGGRTAAGSMPSLKPTMDNNVILKLRWNTGQKLSPGGVRLHD